MLGVIPPEVILTILSFLPFRQLHRLRLVSKSWNKFIYLNESSIYHAAAILHDFVPANTRVLDPRLPDVSGISLVNSWKDLCANSYRMERGWEGHGSARWTDVASGEDVWRFKIDVEQRTVIATHVHGGLTVSGIDEDTVLWSLPELEVCPFAHCEYADGFLVLTREGEALEVWRRKRDSQSSPRPQGLQAPDPHQTTAMRESYQSALSLSENHRGAFDPWTTISPPNPVRALRLVHSTLLVASASAQEAYLYDILGGGLKQTISLRNSDEPPVQVNYVELGSRHIFVCTVHDVLVYPLDASDSQTAFNFPSDVEGFHEFYETQALRVDYSTIVPTYSDTVNCSFLVGCSLDQSVQRCLPPYERDFQAVHVSPCGSHFVTVDEQGCLCIVRNFEEALRNGDSLLDHITILDMRLSITNLAYEDDKRIVVYVHQKGIFVIPIIAKDKVPVDTLTMEPQGHIRLLHAMQIGLSNTFCSCLQLTRSEVWYSWTQIHATPAGPPVGLTDLKLNYIKFSEST